jgi:hypothetical protein
VAAEQWLSMAERLLSGSKGGREGHRRRLANCHWGQTYTFDKMWISGGMIKSLLKIILGRPSCVKEQ